MHGDEVVEVPKGLDIYGSSESCKVESMGRGNKILSFQEHPEVRRRRMCEMAESGKFKECFADD